MSEQTPDSSPIPEPIDSRHAWLRLAFVGQPAERTGGLLARWGTPEAALQAATAGHDDALLATQGVTATTIDRLRQAAAMNIEPALAAMRQHDIRLLLMADEEYPEALRGIPSPPPYLFVRGTVLARDAAAVAIVGTRGATEYGRGLAERLATDLALRGVTVVSGLARGIDTMAHQGALQAGGRTFAVCGCGLDIVYPSDNKGLMLQVQASGAAFSEFAPTVHPESWHFPARNRIISGLSAGVVIVEAGERSGALITADFAMEQGRDVFAVPGNVHRLQSRGTHALIKQGATLIEGVDDVLEALNNRALPFEKPARQKAGAGRRAEATAPRPDLTPTENRLYLALEDEPRHVDVVAAQAGMGPAEANSTLVLLELKGLARRLPGSVFARV